MVLHMELQLHHIKVSVGMFFPPLSYCFMAKAFPELGLLIRMGKDIQLYDGTNDKLHVGSCYNKKRTEKLKI